MDIKLNNVFKTEFNANETFGHASSVAIGIISGLALMYKMVDRAHGGHFWKGLFTFSLVRKSAL